METELSRTTQPDSHVSIIHRNVHQEGHKWLNERLTKAQQHIEARVNMSRIVDHRTMSKKANKAGYSGNKENPQGMLHANF